MSPLPEIIATKDSGIDSRTGSKLNVRFSVAFAQGLNRDSASCQIVTATETWNWWSSSAVRNWALRWHNCTPHTNRLVCC
jgi:hypothetical protein